MLERKEVFLFSTAPAANAELMRDTLQWESYDQTLCWQLLNSQFLQVSEDLVSEFIVLFLEVLDREEDEYPEALLGLLNLLAHSNVNKKCLYRILCLPKGFSSFPWRALGRKAKQHPLMVSSACLDVLELSLLGSKVDPSASEQFNRLVDPSDRSAVSKRALLVLSAILAQTSGPDGDSSSMPDIQQRLVVVVNTARSLSDLRDLISKTNLSAMLS